MEIPTLDGGNGRHAVDGTRAAVFRASWARAAARAGVAGFGLLGVVVLALRAGGAEAVGWQRAAVAAGVVALVAVAGAGIFAWRRRPSGEAVRALLDRRQRLGGLLMADGADGSGASAWSGRLAGVQPLRVGWRGGPTLGLLAGAVAFAAAATLVPIPEAAAGPGALNVDRHVEALEEQIELLEEEEILDAEESDAMRAAAAAVAEDAAAEDPAAAWEALDHLAAELAREGAAAQEQAKASAGEAAAAGALAEAMAEASLTAGQMEAAAEALAELADAALDGDLPPGLAGALAEAAAAGLDPDTLKRLQETMRGREAEMKELMEALAEAGLAPPGGGGEGAGRAAGLDTAALKEFLEGLGEGGGEGDAAAVVALVQTPGRGGLGRGRADAELTWRDPASEEGVSFDPQVLPPSELRDPTRSVKLGVSGAAPELADGGASGGGALGGVTSGGGGSAAAVVLPRHRAAVQRYFERTGE